MMNIGYALSSEEQRPNALVRNAARAEECGFDYAVISDHYHPWTESQGEASFIWSVLGGIAGATSRLNVGTSVTCPIIRYHPALIAQAAATVAAMMEGRFFFGIGSGEFLNEHVYGDHFPTAPVRQAMLEEAVAIIRELWQGDFVEHDGLYFQVEEARLYTLPETLPPIVLAAAGPESARLAGEICDGLITTDPSAEVVDAFRSTDGPKTRPVYGQVTVCFDDSEATARRTAHHYWPIAGLSGPAKWDIRSPRLFDGLAKGVSEDQVAEKIICGPDPARHIAAIREFADAGFDHVHIHQVGVDQEPFFRFYEREILPEFAREPATQRANGRR